VESISINASLRQFRRREIVNSLRKALSTTGVDPASVEVEITESVLAEDVFEALGVLNMIHRLGVRIGIDDFGTGYSSLGYLKRFPFDTLKIDRVFLSDIPENRESLAIAEAVIAIARTLNKRIVAEGVETAAQLDFVRRSGCGIAQGMLLGRPMRGDVFVSWAKNSQSAEHGEFRYAGGNQATA
jgi:EAL domain-containing protein (putative c-di-GMP-specific phosphodiesterase class I)